MLTNGLTKRPTEEFLNADYIVFPPKKIIISLFTILCQSESDPSTQNACNTSLFISRKQSVKNVTEQHLTQSCTLSPVSPGHVLYHLSSHWKCTLLFTLFAYEGILTFGFDFLFLLMFESIKWNDAICILSLKKLWSDTQGNVSWHFLVSSPKHSCSYWGFWWNVLRKWWVQGQYINLWQELSHKNIILRIKRLVFSNLASTIFCSHLLLWATLGRMRYLETRSS